MVGTALFLGLTRIKLEQGTKSNALTSWVRMKSTIQIGIIAVTYDAWHT